MVNETKQCGTIIVGRCKCDSMVQYPFYWCEELISEAKKFNFKVIDLQEEVPECEWRGCSNGTKDYLSLRK